MKRITIDFEFAGEDEHGNDQEDIYVTSEEFEGDEILDALAHTLMYLRLEKHRKFKLERVK